MLPIEELSNPRDDYISWYRDITRVYIGNPANHDTCTVGYYPARVYRRMMEVDDMASGVIQGPTSSLSQIASFAKKVQTIIRRCIVYISGTLGCTPSQHDILQTFPVQPSCRRPREPVPDCGAGEVKRINFLVAGGRHADSGCGRERGERSRGRGRGDLGSSDHGNPFDNANHGQPSFSLGLTPPTQSHPSTLYAPPPPGLGFSSFQSPHPSSLGFSSFQAPPPPCSGSSSFQVPPPQGTVGSSTLHMPISTASSSDTDEHDCERTDVVTPTQQLGFSHRVGKKTSRFTPSDWP
ncbi:hypothetical protein M9H77_22354 [Catharanthus roseus]|uniref:Uncharacterized protein n=1 Tax=Catharanthus roseus TaxID=4058 RepID=A0ACC0AU92_CATRO|nr:hypothetical protein M9H77_22354 [Catharanthus roseus]